MAVRNRRRRVRIENQQTNRQTSQESAPSPLRLFLLSLFSRYKSRPGWTPNIFTVFVSLLVIRICAAFRNGIADCDETYNYWEPLHYMLYGYGFQTWEYSPQFALRSYAYLMPYKMVAELGLMVQGNEKLVAFYTVRIVQGAICALAETYLYDSVVWRFGKGAARMYWIFMMTSPGMFRAATELLPSSFGMIATTAAFAAWYVGEYPRAILFVAMGSLLGWPYIALLGLPLALHVISRRGWRYFSYYALISGFLFFALMVPIDSYYFGRLKFAPLEAIMYNVMPKEGTGPSIFGVEDWSFYGINLFLNMNISFLLVITAYPLLWLVDAYMRKVWENRSEALSRIIFLSPCFIWLFVFGKQPHKEERFLAPVYPLIAVCGAVAFDDWISLIGLRRTKNSVGRLSRWVISVVAVLVCATIGISRIVAVDDGYKAPFQTFQKFTTDELLEGLGPRNAPKSFTEPSAKINVCYGNEWYRFPSNFFVPSERFQIRFIRRDFKGLLPKYFQKGPGGTRVIPRGMNEFNTEDPAQFLNDTSLCHYFVGLKISESGSIEQDNENPIALKDRLLLFSEKFLDAERSPSFYRAFYIPGRTPKKVKYGKYQIFRNLDALPIK